MPKVVVIGWDGATFDLIEPLIQSGRMPNLAGLMQDGVWGRLNSSTPPLTPIAWTSISTGVNPGKHGIIDAFLYSKEERRLRFVNATLRKVRPVWSLLSNQNKSVGVFNVPVTYPPEQVNGFIVSGMFTPEGAPNTMFPPSLQQEIENQFGRYKIECKRHDNPHKYLKGILAEEIEDKTELSLHLYNKNAPDFYFTVFLASDRAQHFFWKYKDASHPQHGKLGEAISIVYENLDKSLGRLLANIPEDSYVMMVSDHGAERLVSSFYLSHWMVQQGYLKLLKDPRLAFSKSVPVKLKSLIKRGALKILPQQWSERIGETEKNNDEINAFISIIDWENTQAFSEGVAGGIFINKDVVKPEDRDNLLTRISNDLLQIKDPDGNDVIQAVHRREDIYSGDYVELAPDLTVICAPGFQVIAPGEVFYYKQNFEDDLFLKHRWSGKHEQEGIFVLRGPGVKNGDHVEECKIEDIAPTVLHLMGCAVPEQMDGNVLLSALESTFAELHPVQFSTEEIGLVRDGTKLSKDEQNKIAKRLTDLGYL